MTVSCSAPAPCVFVRWLLCSTLTCFKIPLVWFWHAVLSHRSLCRTYRAIQTLCRVKWVSSSGWRLNVMALSPGSSIFYPLMFALIRCSARSAPLRNSPVSALLNYAFSWLECGKRVCHFWTFTFNKTDAMSHMLRNPRGCISVTFFAVASFSEENINNSMKVVLLWWRH